MGVVKILVKQPEDLETGGTVFFVNKSSTAKENLLCEGCGAELILGYHPRCFAGIRLKCVKCNTVTETPSPCPGDVFPKGKVVTLSEEDYRIPRSVSFSEDALFVQDIVQKKLIAQSRPSAVATKNFILPNVLERYFTLSDRGEGEARDRLQRYRQSRKSGCLEEPMIWAASVLENPGSACKVALEVAKTWVTLFAHMDSIWRNHPRYEEITSDLKGGGAAFFHTLTVLAVADIWYRNEVPITFNIEEEPKKPDLYVRYTASEERFVEVKVPTRFIWRPETSTDRTYSAYVSKTIRKNRQISSALGTKGHFVFGLFHPRARIGRDLSEAVERFFTAKRVVKPSCTGADVLQFSREGSSRTIKMNHIPYYNPNFK